MTAPDVDALTEQLIGAWWRWDHAPGSPVTAQECIDAEAAFEALGVARLDLVQAITANRRGSPDIAGQRGHRQAVADAVQSAVNDLVPPQLSVVAEAARPVPHEGEQHREAS